MNADDRHPDSDHSTAAVIPRQAAADAVAPAGGRSAAAAERKGAERIAKLLARAGLASRRDAEA